LRRSVPQAGSGSAGAWDSHYTGMAAPYPYGDDTTYKLAAEWVRGCGHVEDWGCGPGWLRRFCDPGTYTGIDGSCSPFADVVADLTTWRSSAGGVVLRHVLEHNYGWREILDGAVSSFTSRLFIAVFTPPAAQTRVMFTEPGYRNVPVIAFATADLLGPVARSGATADVAAVETGSVYGRETVIRARRD